MKILLLLFLVVSCGAGEVTVLTGPTSQESLMTISEFEYLMSLDEAIDKSLSTPNTKNPDLELDTITIGVALDGRVGVGELNVGASTGLDLHFKRIK